MAFFHPSAVARQGSAAAYDGVVVLNDGGGDGHDALAKASLAASIACLLGTRPVDAADEAVTRLRRPYYVPCDTLGVARARQLGIGDWEDLFGGIAPHPFIATKTITHRRVGDDAKAPPGWSDDFGRSVQHVVLDGWTAFDAADARAACARLLPGGAVRVKEADGVGGSGQSVVHDMAGLDALLGDIDPAQLAEHGLVLERNLGEVRTYSVGQVRVGAWLLSYHGQQRLTRNHLGAEVYGGSTLHLVRGDFDALLARPLPEATRTAVEQALVYHRAALRCFPGLVASRSNYDVAQGVDDAGVPRSGVLEQSWRIGGASGAEIVALHAFDENPALRWVVASTHECYGDCPGIPLSACVHFDGVDASVGRLVKYATVDARGDD